MINKKEMIIRPIVKIPYIIFPFVVLMALYPKDLDNSIYYLKSSISYEF
jgi:hypothetical protein